MSGKKQKGGATGWLTCTKCDRRIPRGISIKHVDSDCGLVYPFIFRGVIHATLSKATAVSKIQNLPFAKCSRLSSSTVFLPDELIRESGFRSFSWIAVTPVTSDLDSEDKQTDPYDPSLSSEIPIAMRIWPIPESVQAVSSAPSSSTIMLTSDGFLANRLSISSTSITTGEVSAVKLEPLFDPSHTEVTTSVFPPARSVILELDDPGAVDKSSFDPDRFIESFRNWFRNRLIAQGNRFRIRFYAEVVAFRVKELKTKIAVYDKGKLRIEAGLDSLSLNERQGHKFAEITEETEVQLILMDDLSSKGADKDKEPLVQLENVGGLDPVVKELCSTINFIFNSNMDVAKGILLYGHSGTGKSFLVQALCNHFKLYRVNYDEFRQFEASGQKKNSKTSSNSLVKVFQEAVIKAPAVIIIENLDTLAPKKSTTNGLEQTSNFAINIHSLIPSLSSKSCKVIILATATDADNLDSSLRSPQIFGKEIELPVPSIREREDILKKILEKMTTSLNLEEVKEIAGATHGFVGADLQGLCTQAAQHSIERCIRSSGEDNGWENAKVELKDLTECLKSVKPSAIKSILVDVPNVRWKDIGGQTELKFKLKQAIEWPLKHPEAFQRLGITPPKGILMYGPPGCSKTMIAKAIATESGLNFISVKGSELFSKWVGESEKAVRDVFRKARQVAPCVVFFDEIDSLGSERGTTSGSSNVNERVLAQLLVEIDGIEALKDVTIVAATNRPDIIDQALLRPGRLDRIIYVPLPDAETRRDILRIRFTKMPVDPSVDLDQLVEATEGYSGAELTAICHEAAMKALEEDIESKTIQEKDFVEALEIVKPRISEEQIIFYENYNKSHKRL